MASTTMWLPPAKFQPEREIPWVPLKDGSSSAHKAGLNHHAPKEGCEAPVVHPNTDGSMPPETPIHLII